MAESPRLANCSAHVSPETPALKKDRERQHSGCSAPVPGTHPRTTIVGILRQCNVRLAPWRWFLEQILVSSTSVQHSTVFSGSRGRAVCLSSRTYGSYGPASPVAPLPAYRVRQRHRPPGPTTTVPLNRCARRRDGDSSAGAYLIQSRWPKPKLAVRYRSHRPIDTSTRTPRNTGGYAPSTAASFVEQR
jgi:hypothetical protein